MFYDLLHFEEFSKIEILLCVSLLFVHPLYGDCPSVSLTFRNNTRYVTMQKWSCVSKTV